jgi:hypothetical protein
LPCINALRCIYIIVRQNPGPAAKKLAASQSIASRETAAVCRRQGLRHIDPANPLAEADCSSWLAHDAIRADNCRRLKTFRRQLADAAAYATSALRVR